MEEAPMLLPKPAASPRRWSWLRRMGENPVIFKELRGRMRGRQAVFLLSGYLALIGLIVGLVYLGMAATPNYYYGFDPDYRQNVGKAIFGTVVITELLLVSFVAPSLSAGAITSERERQTFDLLRTTTLPASSLVAGKLVSALVYLLLLIFAALPIESIAFVLGGVGLSEIIGSTLMLVVTALFYCTLGLLFSSLMKKTAGATAASYVTIVISYILLGLAFFLAATLLDSVGGGMELLLAMVFWALISTNPLLAAIISEYILVEEQNLFFTTSAGITPFNGGNLVLPSPWIVYILFYLALTVVLIQISIRLVRRPDR